MEQAQGRHGAAESADHADDLAVYISKRKILWATLFFFAFTVMCVVVPSVLGPTDSVHGLYDNPAMGVLVQVGGGVLGVSLTVVSLMSLFSSAPAVVVSHQGIWVNSPLVLRNATIPWAEIESLLAIRVGRYTYYKQTYLLITLRDRQALRARQNRLQALLWRLTGHSLVWPQEVPVVDVMLPMSAAELLGRIQVRFQPELVQHGIQMQGL